MGDEVKILKAGLTILLLVVFLVGGLLLPPPHQIVADDLPPKEGPPLPPVSEDYVPDQIIVKFKDNIRGATIEQLNQAMETDVVYTSPYTGFKVLEIPKGKTVAEMIEAYSELSNVEYAEPNYIDHITWIPNDTGYSDQWHFSQINLEAAWDLDTAAPNYGGDPSIIVAVIDTGVAYETYDGYVQAPDLASTNFTSGWDYVNSDAHPNDDNNHGTHVCGTIAQSTNNTEGVAGIAFNTTIMPIKAFNSAGSGTHAWIADGFHYAADNGAHIINYSASGSHSTTLENAVAYARNDGVVIVAAMGNKGNTTNDVAYPAAYDDYAIAVGATRYDETRSYYSSYGSHCDIAAPGGDTTVDQNSDGYVDGVLQQTFTSGNVTDFWYYFFQGTSMATPHVSGVAALILAEHPTWTAAQVRHALQSTATDKGTTGRDDEYGWGLLDACNSVNLTLPTATSYSDAVHTTACDNFTGYGTEDTAFMYCPGLLPSQSYGVSYYDEGNDKRATDNVMSDASGNLSSQHTFAPGTDAAGTWHVIVHDQAHTPQSTYSSNWTYAIGEDTFVVIFPPNMETIVEAEGQYYNTAPVFSNFGFDDDTDLDDGWYQMDSYTGSWTSLFTDVSGTEWNNDSWIVPPFAGLSEDSHTIYFKASDDVGNLEGESGEWSWQFYKDTVPPTDPTSVNSTSHIPSTWSSDNIVDIAWIDATDTTSLLDGYSILWSDNATSNPDQAKDIEEGVESANSTALADSDSHYFHIRSVDNAGNWQSTVHVGPFFIDANPPTNPTSVSSTNHTVSTWSSDNTVDIIWTDATDSGSGLDGYSILWSDNATSNPDQAKDIEEGVESANSTALADSDSHYFHIRSVDNHGNWQSTMHVGPFYIAVNYPILADGTVSPASGGTSANFTFSANYTDFEDDDPSSITISIDGGASENMTRKAGQDSVYTNGEIYEYWILGSDLGVGSHTFQFFANDGTDDAIGDIDVHTGPTVSSPPRPAGGGGGGGGAPPPGVTKVISEMSSKGQFRSDVTCKSEDECVELFIAKDTIGKRLKGGPLYTIKIVEAEDQPPAPERTNFVGLVYDLSPEGTMFDPPVDLAIRYDESLITEGVNENSLIIATWDSDAGKWVELESTVDPENNTVTTKIDHFTEFTILVHTRPADFTGHYLSVTPKEVNLGESVSISIIITNSGDLTGSYEVKLKIDNVVVQTKEVTLTAGSIQNVTFSVTSDIAGTCSVDINGLTGSFVVKEEVPVVEEDIEPTPAPAAVPVPEIIPTPTPKPPFNWGLLVGILAGVVTLGLASYFLVRKRIKAKGSG